MSCIKKVRVQTDLWVIKILVDVIDVPQRRTYEKGDGG